MLKCSQSSAEIVKRAIMRLTWFLQGNYRLSLCDRKKTSHFQFPRPPSRILTFVKACLFRNGVLPRGLRFSELKFAHVIVEFVNAGRVS